MVRNLWWELVINISKFLTLSAFPTRLLTLPAVITVGMLTRDKTDSLSKEVSVPESIRVVYSRCQIDRPLYVSMKQDNLITQLGFLILVTSNNLSLFARRKIIVTLICIYICWYLYLLDILNQENLYILTLVYVVVKDQKTFTKKSPLVYL